MLNLFHGRYDARMKKWTAVDVRPISERDERALSYAFNYAPGKAAEESSGGNPNEKERARMLDEKLNLVYQALKFLLPPSRFATVKQEQVQWLKKHDAATGEEKRKLVEARIDALAKAVPD